VRDLRQMGPNHPATGRLAPHRSQPNTGGPRPLAVTDPRKGTPLELARQGTIEILIRWNRITSAQMIGAISGSSARESEVGVGDARALWILDEQEFLVPGGIDREVVGGAAIARPGRSRPLSPS
jgi:hypothetical protein